MATAPLGFWATVCKTVRPMLYHPHDTGMQVAWALATLCYMGTHLSTHVCCGQMAAWIKMPLGMEVEASARRLCVKWGPSSPSQKRGRSPSPIFGPCPLKPTAGWINMALGTEAGLGPGHIVLDGDPALPCPQFSAHFHCGQMAGYIKMPLDMKLDLSPGPLC